MLMSYTWSCSVQEINKQIQTKEIADGRAYADLNVVKHTREHRRRLAVWFDSSNFVLTKLQLRMENCTQFVFIAFPF